MKAGRAKASHCGARPCRPHHSPSLMRSSTPSIANARLSCSIINQRLALRDLAGGGEAQGKPYYAFIDHSADTLQLNSIERPDMDQKDIHGDAQHHLCGQAGISFSAHSSTLGHKALVIRRMSRPSC
jgi:hypothetical protein